MKKPFKVIIFVVIELLVTFLFLEAAARYYFYRWNTNQSVPFLIFGKNFKSTDGIQNLIAPSAKGGIVYELKPSLNTNYLDKQFVTNTQGVLGAMEYSYENPENTIRIVGVGDSVMSSWGNDFKDTYLEQLSFKLSSHAAPREIQTINLSVPGYNTVMEKM